MTELDDAIHDVRRAAAWLEDASGSVVENHLPFTQHRAMTILAAFTGVDEARARYNRALLEAGWPDEY